MNTPLANKARTSSNTTLIFVKIFKRLSFQKSGHCPTANIGLSKPSTFYRTLQCGCKSSITALILFYRQIKSSKFDNNKPGEF